MNVLEAVITAQIGLCILLPALLGKVDRIRNCRHRRVQ